MEEALQACNDGCVGCGPALEMFMLSMSINSDNVAANPGEWLQKPNEIFWSGEIMHGGQAITALRRVMRATLRVQRLMVYFRPAVVTSEPDKFTAKTMAVQMVVGPKSPLNPTLRRTLQTAVSVLPDDATVIMACDKMQIELGVGQPVPRSDNAELNQMSSRVLDYIGLPRQVEVHETRIQPGPPHGEPHSGRPAHPAGRNTKCRFWNGTFGSCRRNGTCDRLHPENGVEGAPCQKSKEVKNQTWTPEQIERSAARRDGRNKRPAPDGYNRGQGARKRPAPTGDKACSNPQCTWANCPGAKAHCFKCGLPGHIARNCTLVASRPQQPQQRQPQRVMVAGENGTYQVTEISAEVLAKVQAEMAGTANNTGECPRAHAMKHAVTDDMHHNLHRFGIDVLTRKILLVALSLLCRTMIRHRTNPHFVGPAQSVTDNSLADDRSMLTRFAHLVARPALLTAVDTSSKKKNRGGESELHNTFSKTRPLFRCWETDVAGNMRRIDTTVLYDPQCNPKTQLLRVFVYDTDTGELDRSLSAEIHGPQGRPPPSRGINVYETDGTVSVHLRTTDKPTTLLRSMLGTPRVEIWSDKGVLEKVRGEEMPPKKPTFQKRRKMHGALDDYTILRYLRTNLGIRYACGPENLVRARVQKISAQANRLPRLPKATWWQVHRQLAQTELLTVKPTAVQNTEPSKPLKETTPIPGWNMQRSQDRDRGRATAVAIAAAVGSTVAMNYGTPPRWIRRQRARAEPNLQPPSQYHVNMMEGDFWQTEPSSSTKEADTQQRAPKRRRHRSESRRMLVDSGTNRHVSNDLDDFVKYKAFTSPRVVTCANGSTIYAKGIGEMVIALPAEKLQQHVFAQESRPAPEKQPGEWLYLHLGAVLYVPGFQKPYLDTTQIRRSAGGNISIVGDMRSNRIIDHRRCIQSTLTEINGNEYTDCRVLTQIEYHSLEGVQANSVMAETVTDFPDVDHTRSRAERRRVTRAIAKLSLAELEEVVMSTAEEKKYDNYTREACRIEMAKAGDYRYRHAETDLLLAWHHKLAHASLPLCIKKMKELGLFKRLSTAQRVFCHHCLLSNPRRQPMPKVENRQPYRLFEKFYCDVSGPHTPAVQTGAQYALTFIERASGLALTYFAKSTAEVATHTGQFLKDIAPFMKTAGVKDVNMALSHAIVASDNASYFVGRNSGFRKELAKHGTTQVSGTPYTPQHQARVERHQQTISRRAAALRKAAGLDSRYWEASWRYANRVYNLVDNGNTVHNKSPMYVATGNAHPEQLLELKAFGAAAYVTVPIKHQKEDTSKVVWQGTYLGPTNVKGSHYVADTRNPNYTKVKQVHHLRVADVVPKRMAEGAMFDAKSDVLTDPNLLIMYDDDLEMDAAGHNAENPDQPEADAAPNPAEDSVIDVPEEGVDYNHPDTVLQVPGDFINIDKINVESIECMLKHRCTDMGAEIHSAHYSAVVSDKIHYSKATAYRDNPGYRDSDEAELHTIEKNQVWERVPVTDLNAVEKASVMRAVALRYPKWTSVGGVKTLSKLKTRVVVDGRSMNESQSGKYIASSTPRTTSLMMHFGATPLTPNEVNRQADITGAFLKVKQYTADGSRCFVRLPADMAEYTTINGRRVELVYLLKRTLYGQPNSPFLFEQAFSEWATTEGGLVRSTVDPCLYYSPSGKLRLLQMVDDSHLRGCPKEAAAFEKAYEQKWGSKFEDAAFWLNMNITRDREGMFSLSQPAYARDLVKRFGMQDARGASTPLPPGTNVDKSQRATSTEKEWTLNPKTNKMQAKSAPMKKGQKPKPTSTSEAQLDRMSFKSAAERRDNQEVLEGLIGPNVRKYKEALGAISYYANQTRPDLSHAVSMLGQVASAPTMEHWRLIQHVLRYIKETPDRGIKFKLPEKNEAANRVECFVDSTFGDSPNGTSRTGYLYFMNNAPVSWASRLQSAAATSTMEAEVAAACDAGHECKFINDLLYEMERPSLRAVHFRSTKPLVFHEDNAACIVFCNTKSVTRRNRHMQRPCNMPGDPDLCIPCAKRHTRQNYFVIRQLIEDGEAAMVKIDTAKQTADCLTKALGPYLYQRHRDTMVAHITPLVTESNRVPTGGPMWNNRVNSVETPSAFTDQQSWKSTGTTTSALEGRASSERDARFDGILIQGRK